MKVASLATSLVSTILAPSASKTDAEAVITIRDALSVSTAILLGRAHSCPMAAVCHTAKSVQPTMVAKSAMESSA